MAVLVACLGAGKGSWSLVGKLLRAHDWKRMILVGDDFASKFTHEKKFEFVKIDERAGIPVIADILVSGFRDLGFDDVATNLSSGAGDVHMALLLALMRSGVGIRFVSVDDSGRLVDLSQLPGVAPSNVTQDT